MPLPTLLRRRRRHEGEAPPANPDELQRLLAAWNPMPTSVLGFGGFIAMLALMLLKPV